MRAQFSTVISAARVEGFGACGLLRLLGRLFNCVCRARRKDDAHCRGRDTLLDDGPTAECAHSQGVAGSDEREHEHGDRSRPQHRSHYAKQNSESRGHSHSVTVTLSHCEHMDKTDTRQYSTASRDRHSLRDQYSGIHPRGRRLHLTSICALENCSTSDL